MAESSYRRRDIDIWGILIRLFFAFAIGMCYDSGRIGVGFAILSGLSALVFFIAMPPVGVVAIEDGHLRVQRAWSQLWIPLENLRAARSIDVGMRRIREFLFEGPHRPRRANEWRMTIASQRGVELIFKSDLPRRTKMQLPDEHTFRVIFGDREGLLAALSAAGVTFETTSRDA